MFFYLFFRLLSEGNPATCSYVDLTTARFCALCPFNTCTQMNYRRLISLLAERSGKTQRASREEIALFVSAIKEVLAAVKRVTIPRLGTFSTTADEARSPKPASTEPETKPAVVRRVEVTRDRKSV